MRIVLPCLFLFVSASLLHAQSPASIQRDQMSKLDWIKGDWRGTGWMQRGPGGKKDFHQIETVQSRLDGLVMIVEGVGRSVADGSPVHHALMFVNYDTDEKRFRWRAFTVEGGQIDAEGEVGTNRLRWGFKVPDRGRIRYTVELTPKGDWFEIGEFSPDGNTWSRFLEMTLVKQE